MKRVTTIAAAIALGTTLAAGAGTAFADHTTRDLCAGVVEADGCWYCTYQGGIQAQSPTNCHDGYFGYTWEECGVYAAGVCVVGRIV